MILQTEKHFIWALPLGKKPKGGPSREGETALWVFRSELLL
jgi:hypothetical protein